MVNATAWDIGTTGYSYLTNETNISIFRSAISGWQQSGEGIAAFLIFSFLILSVGVIIMMRTHRIIPSVFAMLMTTFVVYYYKLLEFRVSTTGWYATRVLIFIYPIIIIGLAIGVVYLYKKGGD